MNWFKSDDRPALVKLVDDLPNSGITVYSLKALDFIVPGEWQNITDFQQLLKTVTREEDEAFLKSVAKKAIQLYDDKSEGYQTAMWLYSTVDKTDKALGTAALADKVSKRFKLFSFLDRLTPKADTTQVIDLTLKLIVELVAYTKINGLPGDSVSDFVKGLQLYSGEAKLRMGALICFDGLIPLGPDFITTGLDTLDNLNPKELAKNDTFKKLSDYIPGADAEGKLQFIHTGFNAAQSWMQNFITEHDLHVDKVVDSLTTYVDIADSKLDYLAAFIDMASNYYEHTGTQTLATRIIERAVNEV